MTYKEAVDYLYSQTPQFQRIGAAAYKPGLDTVRRLAAAWGHPEKNYPTIHVGGTNGKGSTAHTLAAVLQEAGYKVGLFTSPHLVDFRERIKVNGVMVPQDYVSEFVERFRTGNPDGLEPSFFELTTVMAFDYFAREGVDVAVIEVGLGGRLDSTNIITPVLSVITNISFDHTAQLGNTLGQIAGEKAGIIKRGVPVVVGEAEGEVRRVFVGKAAEECAPILFAQDHKPFSHYDIHPDYILYRNTPFGDLRSELTGDCQPLNAATILTALGQLAALGWQIPDTAVRSGFANVCELTGLRGRWMCFGKNPLRVCDTGHNIGGWRYLGHRLGKIAKEGLHVVVGFVNDKDVSHILPLMPREARYYFAQASVPRALPSSELQRIAAAYGLKGEAYSSVKSAYSAALASASPSDTIFVGGSTFVVADLLAGLE